mmetsp:Transcript_45313/g.106750  ORF Transcript_45313/g.106750 Transcript_45313/m.106750 type:complete len:265 (-) Transcript_45313:27-821(-)
MSRMWFSDRSSATSEDIMPTESWMYESLFDESEIETIVPRILPISSSTSAWGIASSWRSDKSISCPSLASMYSCMYSRMNPTPFSWRLEKISLGGAAIRDSQSASNTLRFTRFPSVTGRTAISLLVIVSSVSAVHIPSSSGRSWSLLWSRCRTVSADKSAISGGIMHSWLFFAERSTRVCRSIMSGMPWYTELSIISKMSTVVSTLRPSTHSRNGCGGRDAKVFPSRISSSSPRSEQISTGTSSNDREERSSLCVFTASRSSLR